MQNGQMELGFGGERQLRPFSRRQHRLERAAWWFSQMRQAVDRAMDWSSATPTLPEQPWLPGACRETQVWAAAP